MHYVRRSAVGDCNIGPGAGTSWPQTPAGVALRCLEQLNPAPGEPSPSVVFLVPPDQSRFELLTAATPPSEYKFRVQAPRASEHVLMRWNMPATILDAAKREEAVKALKTDLVTIFAKRDALMQTIGSEAPKNHRLAPVEVPEILPVDPAVAKVGLQWKFASGAEGTASFEVSVIDISIASAKTSGKQADNGFTVGEGDFLTLTFHALVADEDLERFDPRMLETHLMPEPGKPLWPGFRAFEGSEVFVETASSDLPQPETVRLSLLEDAEGHIAVRYDFPPGAGFESVHEVFIESERWVWRNLPIPPEEDHPGGSDRLRRLASGPPLDLMDASRRDDSPAVARFDKLSEIDNGFIGRSDQVVPYPPTADGVTLLKLDARDEHAHADYLRYLIAFRSRYAPVLRTAMSGWTAKRRIAAGFRGDVARIKPPRMLAVLPLLRAMPAPGSEDKEATPFLVVLDETWFREYGLGERLAARVARVKPEIPETPDDPPKEFRYGPLPDHRLDAPKKDALEGHHELDVFGPFGLSHERGGSQALANATTFVVYPPAGTPPHFNLFAEFARVLDVPTALKGKAPVSEYTEAVALYTLPDMAHIQLGGRGRERLLLRSVGKRYQCEGAGKLLPFPGATGDVLQQYRYVLVVGHHVLDGGRAVDVFLPADALWIAPTGKDDTIEAMWLGQAERDVKKSGYNAAVVLEILLNGRFPEAMAHPLQSAEDLRQLFRLMLHDGPKPTKQGEPTELLQDAPGMIRRVSEWFEVEFGA